MGANNLPKTITGQHRHLGYAIPWDRRNRLLDGVKIPREEKHLELDGERLRFCRL